MSGERWNNSVVIVDENGEFALRSVSSATAVDKALAVGGVDAFAPAFDLAKIMPPFGVKLDRGSTQRLVCRVNDNVSTADAFNAVAYGFDRFE